MTKTTRLAINVIIAANAMNWAFFDAVGDRKEIFARFSRQPPRQLP
jgi:hypothetical protein